MTDPVEALKGVVELVSNDHQPNDWFRCQQRSIVSMLNAGIRAFDLRYAQDVTNSTLVFWHGRALQSQTATVDAVMFGCPSVQLITFVALARRLESHLCYQTIRYFQPYMIYIRRVHTAA